MQDNAIAGASTLQGGHVRKSEQPEEKPASQRFTGVIKYEINFDTLKALQLAGWLCCYGCFNWFDRVRLVWLGWVGWVGLDRYGQV